jgi:hypothetical protein
MTMKNSNDTIGNRTRDLPACNAVPQPTAPECSLLRTEIKINQLEINMAEIQGALTRSVISLLLCCFKYKENTKTQFFTLEKC